MHYPQPSNIAPIWVRPSEACRIASVGTTKLYEWIGNGRVRSIRVDGKRLIEVESLRRLGEFPQGANA